MVLLLWAIKVHAPQSELEAGEVRAVSSHRSDGIRRIECVTVSSRESQALVATLFHICPGPELLR